MYLCGRVTIICFSSLSISLRYILIIIEIESPLWAFVIFVAHEFIEEIIKIADSFLLSWFSWWNFADKNKQNFFYPFIIFLNLINYIFYIEKYLYIYVYIFWIIIEKSKLKKIKRQNFKNYFTAKILSVI